MNRDGRHFGDLSLTLDAVQDGCEAAHRCLCEGERLFMVRSLSTGNTFGNQMGFSAPVSVVWLQRSEEELQSLLVF